MAVTPAAPVGVSAATGPTPTTVTAVTTDWLPLGSVLVCTTVLVEEDEALLPVVLAPPPEGEMVRAPPPTVETTTRPTLLVLVTTSPRVREDDEVPVVEVDPPVAAAPDVVGLEPEPAAIPPLDGVLAEVVVGGVLSVAPAAGVLVSPLELEVVLKVVSPP